MDGRRVNHLAVVGRTVEVRQSIATFNDEAIDHPKRVRVLLRSTRYWVFDPDSGWFGPSKFVGFAGMDFSLYEAAINWQATGARFDGGVTRRAILAATDGAFEPDDSMVSLLESWGRGLAGAGAFTGISTQKWRFLRLDAAPREPRAHALLCRRATYDVEAAARALDVDTWTLQRGDPAPGDRVVFWRTKGRGTRRGIVALGEVVSKPQRILPEVGSRGFWPEGMTEEAARRFRLRYIVPSGAPIWLEDDTSGLLTSLSVSRGQGARLYRVTNVQWNGLVQLLGGSPGIALDATGTADRSDGTDVRPSGGPTPAQAHRPDSPDAPNAPAPVQAQSPVDAGRDIDGAPAVSSDASEPSPTTLPELPQLLLEAHGEGELAIMVGSGLSMGPDVIGDFPGWKGIPRRMLTDCSKWMVGWSQRRIDHELAGLEYVASTGDMLAKLDTLKHALGRNYRRAMGRLFRPAGALPGAAHQALIRTRARALLTTNYDELIERAAGPERTSYSWRRSTDALADLIEGRSVILKVHGCATDPESMVLTRREYDALAANGGYRAVMEYLLSRYSVLFVGYGMNDPFDLDRILRGRVELMRSTTRTHFILVRRDGMAEAERWQRDYNVYAIPYDDHSLVPHILRTLGDSS